jgi:hypothetical protein
LETSDKSHEPKAYGYSEKNALHIPNLFSISPMQAAV